MSLPVPDTMTIASMREWLAHWGDGPNWCDPKGESVQIPKVTLARLLDDIEMWKRRAEQHGCNINQGDAECG